MKLWIVGRIFPEKPEVWDLHGVFTDQAVAETECPDENFFVGPIDADRVSDPVKREEWPGAYYPKAKR